MTNDTGKDSFLLIVKRLVLSLPGRVALAMLSTWVIAAVAFLVFRLNLTVLPVALTLASLAVVGLAAGLASRWWLGQRTLALRLVVAFLSLSGGLWLSGFLTQGAVGFRLFPRSDVAVDWIGLGQLAAGCLVAALALFAWRISPAIKMKSRKTSGNRSRSPRPSTPKRTPRRTTRSGKSARPKKTAKLDRRPPVSRKRTPAVKKRQPLAVAQRSLRAAQRAIRANQQDFTDTQRKFWANRRNFWATRRTFRVTPRNFWVTQRKFWVRTGAAVNTRVQSLRTAGRDAQIRLRGTGRALQYRLQTGSQTARTHLRNRLTPGSGRSMVQFRKHQRSARSALPVDSPVRLIGETEHRCPYCLEVVVRNDPRGIKICPVCHTQHHADCWAVTGTCQVPHQYE